MTKGRQIQLEQRPKAEENIAVAAASILARDEFVSRMNSLESQISDSAFLKEHHLMLLKLLKILLNNLAKSQ
jgi:hypothetical protein